MNRTSLLASAAAIATLACAAGVSAQTYSRAVPAQPSYGSTGGQCGPGGCGTPGPVGFGPGQITNEDYPPNAAPGQCFTKVLVPEVTESYVEHVLVSPEKTEIKVIPGGSSVEDKTILVKEESAEYYSVAATYRTVTETVVVKAGYTRTETIPATYETISEQVKIKDGYTA
ncbi:MAG: hypothetical protein M3N05_03300, partial [Pseudomonadota bacterium]|nr:hypothetical protein [Pseudomonadota bacterium]